MENNHLQKIIETKKTRVEKYQKRENNLDKLNEKIKEYTKFIDFKKKNRK